MHTHKYICTFGSAIHVCALLWSAVCISCSLYTVTHVRSFDCFLLFLSFFRLPRSSDHKSLDYNTSTHAHTCIEFSLFVYAVLARSLSLCRDFYLCVRVRAYSFCILLYFSLFHIIRRVVFVMLCSFALVCPICRCVYASGAHN